MNDIPRVDFETWRLPNGLRVILHLDRKLPVAHVNQWFHVGSKNERPGRTGFAHLFEHIMFQGSQNAPDDYFKFVERAGANLSAGGVNGTTDNDRTNYFATVPSGNLELLLWLESDRLATLADALTQENLDNQRDVVKNERRQGLENTPYGRWYKLLNESVYPAGHPYSWPVIGSHEDLTAASLDDIREFFRAFYTPNNLSLVVAGDFDVEQARALVDRYFGGIPAGPALERPRRFVPRLEGERIVEVSDRVPQERTYMAWVGPEYFAPGDAELDVASLVLSDGLSSRLNRALVYDRQLCTAASAFNGSREIAGMFVVSATARPGASLREIEETITALLGELARHGPTEDEMRRARAKQEFSFVSGLERIGGFGGKADLLNRYATFLDEPGALPRDVARYRAVDADAVRDAVKRWVDTGDRVLLRFHPETSGRASTAVLDRAQAPPLGADRRFEAPQVVSARLENGLEVLVVERTELPKVAVMLVNRAGSVHDPADKLGLANMLIRTIDMGTTRRSALEIEDALGDLGTALGGSATREEAQLGLEALKREIGPALAILAEVAKDATFPDAELDRERNRQLDALSQQAKDASSITRRVRSMLVFGAEHPYGRPLQGRPQTVGAITRDDLVRFRDRHWRPRGSALVFVGDVTVDEAVSLAREHFGDWAGEAPPSPAVPPGAPADARRAYLVDRQDAAQTVVSLAMPGPSRLTPDYYALSLADAVWGGGGFGTRLNLNLREDKGYSYGVFSGLGLLTQGGQWFASGGVQTDKTRESVLEFEKELAGIAGEKPLTEAEFEDARVRRVRGYAQQFESLSRVAGQVAELWSSGLPMTELQHESDAIAATTLAEARAAALRWARPEKAILLLVGDRARIEPALRDLGREEIVVLDAEGRPAAAEPPIAVP